MKRILATITECQREFDSHPFLISLDGDPSIERLRRFGAGLTFWVCAFQDVLRIHEDLVMTPLVRRIAGGLRRDDRGHDQWFMHDMQLLGTELGVRALFGPAHRLARDSTYALVAELYRTQSEYARLALILLLEACGKVFFSRMARYTKGFGPPARFKWFADSHANAEATHEVWEDAMQTALAEVVLPDGVHAEAVDVVRRSLAALGEIMTHLERLADADAHFTAAELSTRVSLPQRS